MVRVRPRSGSSFEFALGFEEDEVRRLESLLKKDDDGGLGKDEWVGVTG